MSGCYHGGQDGDGHDSVAAGGFHHLVGEDFQLHQGHDQHRRFKTRAKDHHELSDELVVGDHAHRDRRVRLPDVDVRVARIEEINGAWRDHKISKKHTRNKQADANSQSRKQDFLLGMAKAR